MNENDKKNMFFNRYEELTLIGKGGMGNVYKVRDSISDKILALKTLIPKAGRNAKSIERFKTEFASMQNLNHPNIIKAFDFHEEGEDYFGFTMELVDSSDLGNLIYEGNKSLGINESINLLKEIAEGLAAAHSQKIIHRDLKPANILVESTSNTQQDEGILKAKITDFGLAQQESDGEDLSESSNRIGTAYYMSPEQHRGEEVDSRTDIYSFGILAFELFTKQRPFDGSTPFKLFLAHVSEKLPAARSINQEIPKWIETMIEICTEKNRNHRYSNITEIVQLINSKTKNKKKSLFSFFS